MSYALHLRTLERIKIKTKDGCWKRNSGGRPSHRKLGGPRQQTFRRNPVPRSKERHCYRDANGTQENPHIRGFSWFIFPPDWIQPKLLAEKCNSLSLSAGFWCSFCYALRLYRETSSGDCRRAANFQGLTNIPVMRLLHGTSKSESSNVTAFPPK